MQNEFYPVRVFFRKEGRMKYISHLDLIRCFTRELKRSGLPVWHTLGFNPHIYLTFALPLSLGYESLCESFDFRLTEKLPLETVRVRLKEVFPAGITVETVNPPVQKPEAIAFADYRIRMEYERDGVQAGECLRNWLEQPEILVVKRSKKGGKQVNARPHVTVRHLDCEDQVVQLSLRCAAGPQFNLNPTLLLDSFSGETGHIPDLIHVVRTAMMAADGQPWD